MPSLKSAYNGMEYFVMLTGFQWIYSDWLDFLIKFVDLPPRIVLCLDWYDLLQTFPCNPSGENQISSAASLRRLETVLLSRQWQGCGTTSQQDWSTFLATWQVINKSSAYEGISAAFIEVWYKMWNRIGWKHACLRPVTLAVP